MLESVEFDLSSVSENSLHTPLRRCVVKKSVFPKSNLLRFTITDDHSVAWDPKAKRSGRGIWLSAGFGSFSVKELTKGFSHAARAKVEISPELYDLVEKGLSAEIETVVKQVKNGELAAFCSYQDEEMTESFKSALENSEIGTLIYAKDKLKSHHKEFILSKDESIKMAECDDILFKEALRGWSWLALRKGSYATQVWKDCWRLQALRTSLLKRNANSSSVKSMD